MNREDVIRMAQEAGGLDITSFGWTSWVGTQTTDFLERFAKRVADAEREACAKIVDDSQDGITFIGDRHVTVAAAIRARGNT